MNTATETDTEHLRSPVQSSSSHLSASVQGPVDSMALAPPLTDKAQEPPSGGRGERPLRRVPAPRQSMDFDDLPDGSINRTSHSQQISSTLSRASAHGSSEVPPGATQIKDQIDEAFTAYVNGFVSGEMPLLDAVSHLCKLYPPVPVEMRWRHWAQPDNPLGFKAPANSRLQTLDEKTYRHEVMRMFHKRMVEALSKARKQAREKYAQLAREQGSNAEGSAARADANASTGNEEQPRGARRVYKCYVRRVGDGRAAASRKAEREPEWLAHVTVAKDSFYPAAAVDIIRAALEGTPMPLSIPDALAAAHQAHVVTDTLAQTSAETAPQSPLPAHIHAPAADFQAPVAHPTTSHSQQVPSTRKRRSKTTQPSRTPPAPAHAAATSPMQVALPMTIPATASTPTPAHDQGPLSIAALPSVSPAALVDVSYQLVHTPSQAALQLKMGLPDTHRIAVAQPLPLSTLSSQPPIARHAQSASMPTAAQAPPQAAAALQSPHAHHIPAAAASVSARVPSRTRMPKSRASTPTPAALPQEPASLFAAGVAVRAMSAEEQERAMRDMLRLLREPVSLATPASASTSPPAGSTAAEVGGLDGAAGGDGHGDGHGAAADVHECSEASGGAG